MNIKPPRAFLLWLAGFWDGDGSFSISMRTVRRPYGEYPSYGRSVHITNTNKPVLEYIQDVLQAGALFNISAYRSQQNPKHKEAWKLEFSAAESRELAVMLQPHLRIKGQQAKIIAEWPLKQPGGHSRDLTTHEEQRLLYERMKALNHRGP